jgi:chromate transporter
MHPSGRKKLTEVALLFLKLGATAFGGPAAHLAIMRNEVVSRRNWLNDQEFLDLIGAVNLIPGPNSTEMAIHIGFLRAGWPGLLAGGLCFIMPAMAIVLILAWAYVRYSAIPQAGWLLSGIKPVIIAVIVQALWIMGRKAVKGPLTMIVGACALASYFARINEIALLFAGGFVVMLFSNFKRLISSGLSPAFTPLAGAIFAKQIVVPFDIPLLFLTFLKIGAILFGSGYVLFAFLHADFVVHLGWLTERQLIDAIAVGQATPGPLFTTATFIGYILAGVPGALLATLGIFLPSFVFVAASNPLISRMRHSEWLGSLLDGINAASLGLLAAVTLKLGQASLAGPFSISLCLASLGLLFKYRINPIWLIPGGAVIGLLGAAFQML